MGKKRYCYKIVTQTISSKNINKKDGLFVTSQSVSMTMIGEVGTAEGVTVTLDRVGAEGRKVESSES